MINITVVTLNVIHKWREETVEKDRDYSRESDTRKKLVYLVKCIGREV